MSAKGQDRTSCFSFDDLVCSSEQRLRNVEAQRLRGFEIDHQFEFVRRLHRQVTGLLTFENAIDIRRGATDRLVGIRPIRHEAAVCRVIPIGIGRRQFVAGEKIDDEIAMRRRAACRDNGAAVPGTPSIRASPSYSTCPCGVGTKATATLAVFAM